MKKDWRCRIWWHRMVKKYSTDGDSPSAYYYECARCGKFRDVPYRPPASYLGL